MLQRAAFASRQAFVIPASEFAEKVGFDMTGRTSLGRPDLYFVIPNPLQLVRDLRSEFFPRQVAVLGIPFRLGSPTSPLDIGCWTSAGNLLFCKIPSRLTALRVNISVNSDRAKGHV